jgi:hypothetical protein
VVFLVSAGIAIYKLWPDLKHDVAGYSFPETLAKTTKAAGGDARVLSFIVRGQDFSYSVVTRDGRVVERFYGELCSSRQHCAVRESRHEHRATSRERELALVRLSDIRPSIVGQLRHDAGGSDDETVGLQRRQWVVAKAEPYIADADGSHLHRAESPAELAFARAIAQAPDTR